MDWREVAKDVVIKFNKKIFAHFEKKEMDTFFTILKRINKIKLKANKQLGVSRISFLNIKIVISKSRRIKKI